MHHRYASSAIANADTVSSSVTPLVLSVDDYGFHPGVDEAVLELANERRITATSCLTSSPRWPQAARGLTTDVRRQISVGLHLDFTEFHGVAPLRELVHATLRRRLDASTVEVRIARQLDAFEDALGTAPDYVDGHQHVHQLPVIRTVLLAELGRRYPYARPWIRISRPTQAGIKGWTIRALGADAFATAAALAGFRASRRLLGVYGFDLTVEQYTSRLARWLQRARTGDAFMFHPARTAAPKDPISAARQIEYSVLRSAIWPALLARFGIDPVAAPDG